MEFLKGGERGFLLLTSNLGDPDRKPLTVAQFRELMARIANLDVPEPDRDMEIHDIAAMGYGPNMAQHILELLQEEWRLDRYLARAKKQGIVPITRATEQYPILLRKRLGMDSPGCLWARGDLRLLERSAIALVGSRELKEENRRFAAEVGCQAAKQGLVLVSGNARGADKTAQNSCLAAGGQVISVVADALQDHDPRENVLYLSEGSYDEPFSAQRALSRNRLIHALGRVVFVAQSDLGKGGTWDGTVKNLRHGWSNVVCFRDGSEASRQLSQQGAFLVEEADLTDFGSLAEQILNDLDCPL